ncbi:hypothetical protein F442_20778 [Phytophthora nicotianae P10297]|uniref:Uncharacterized protein n=4 Tax=Phytophthora nicotianae TaxID=4792 RepID=V9E0R8_PHYNI|nr:hypothetical protein F443_20974 [Phytophthora nicotianae P1569]ETK72527.1 hypothetical protein L915_20378 [Phytophthora nicotianae]ETL84198.1 hypothetical protein L917_15939 [Phytophthora nicotianae]ETO60889.1 hypothetical protein F444_20976 [Phytophthora nicotianae P1976]ETP30135.1 hypothetical protein F442_20778 [Phytophthora nicotianae P10297]
MHHMIPRSDEDPDNGDPFEAGEPEDPGTPSVLGRRFYIDDVLTRAESWDQLCKLRDSEGSTGGVQ